MLRLIEEKLHGNLIADALIFLKTTEKLFPEIDLAGDVNLRHMGVMIFRQLPQELQDRYVSAIDAADILQSACLLLYRLRTRQNVESF